MRVGLVLMRNVLTPLAKIFLMQLVLTSVSSATDTPIKKKIFGYDMTHC